MIESFEARYAESRAEVAQLAEQLAAAQQAADTSGVRVRELVDAKARLREQQEREVAARADAEAALRAQVAALQGEAARVGPLQQQVAQVEVELADARADLAAEQRQQQALLATVDAANDAIVVSHLGRSAVYRCWHCTCSAICPASLDWVPFSVSCTAAMQSVQAALTEREQVVAQRDAEVASLQAHLARLLGMPEADVPALHAARFGPQAGAAPADRAAAARIAALEVSSLVGSAANAQHGTGWHVPSVWHTALPTRISAFALGVHPLQAANERLEMALVDATRSAAAAAGGSAPVAEPSAAGSEVDLVAELQAKLAVAMGRLQASDERVAQLEKLLKVSAGSAERATHGGARNGGVATPAWYLPVALAIRRCRCRLHGCHCRRCPVLLQVAEATVLHNEAQLQEGLEARCTAEEQVLTCLPFVSGLRGSGAVLWRWDVWAALTCSGSPASPSSFGMSICMRCGWSWRGSRSWWGSLRHS